MRGAYRSETSHLNHQRVPSSSQTSMSHLVPLLEFNLVSISSRVLTGCSRAAPILG